MSRDHDIGRIAFCRTESIGAPKLVFAAQWLAYAIPVNASLRPSRVAAHDSGAVWFATPSPQRTHMGVFGSSGQVHRHIKNSGGCFGIQGLSPIS